VTKEQKEARARQSGQSVDTSKKFAAGSNRQKQPAVRATTLDVVGTTEEPEVLRHAQVTHNMALRIQQARQKKGWTQKELAQRISEKPQVINDYEAGRAIPSQAILAKLERELDAKIRGK
jgi:putative transcription factor